MRTAVVLVISWGVLTGVEKWGEQAPWGSAVLRGLLWAAVVTGAWWFAEWTQIQRPPRTPRDGAAPMPDHAVAGRREDTRRADVAHLEGFER
ncbi:hypothetical protein [Streptomyces sp. CB00455]|uniref:hypothetical protein n=1 Tax=Streptomyces sp. CB00455 TaxID=1703927 RepID=UPI00116111BE|nr:hypothetical protein [Streptomyces sp. CB00455]